MLCACVEGEARALQLSIVACGPADRVQHGHGWVKGLSASNPRKHTSFEIVSNREGVVWGEGGTAFHPPLRPPLVLFLSNSFIGLQVNFCFHFLVTRSWDSGKSKDIWSQTAWITSCIFHLLTLSPWKEHRWRQGQKSEVKGKTENQKGDGLSPEFDELWFGMSLF